MLAKVYEGFATGIDKTFDCKQAHSATVYIEHLKQEKTRLLNMLQGSKMNGEFSYSKNGMPSVETYISDEFTGLFKAITGIEFNEKNIQKFIELNEQKIDSNSPQYQNAFKKAFGTRLIDNTSEFVGSKAFWANCGNLTLNIYAMMNPFARGATGAMAGGLTKAGLGTLSSNALANAAIMGGSTALLEGIDLMVKDAPVTRNDILNYVQSVAISTGFGAFAGYMSPTFQKVCSSVSTKAATQFPKIFKAPSVKKLEAVTKSLETGQTLNGSELMTKYLSTPGSNIAGKSAEFLTEVLAFSGYSIAAGTITEFAKLAFDTDGTLKSQYSNEDSLLDLITKELGHQIEGLTSCKALTKILMAFCSKKYTQTGMIQEQLKSFETLKNIDFKYTEINGQKVLIAQTPKGNIKINSPAEAVNLCQQLALTESAILMNKDLQEQKVEGNNNQDPIILQEVNNLRNNYTAQAERLNNLLKEAGLNEIGELKSRVKSEQSLYDKIANYLAENPSATIEDAVKSVRDAFGARTIVESQDYTQHPEVKALIEARDIKGAQLRAAELQSAPALEKLKGIILAQAQGKDGLETARISNYVSENGIPYFSEAQLAELKQFGAQHGVNIDYVVKVDKSDPLYAQMKAEGKKPTTKAQPSGYTALQINFKTKTGEILEWQFRGDKVNNFAEGEHIPYDLRTNKDIIGTHKELEPLYEPIKELLSKEKMSEETYNEYNRYLTDYYNHLRKLELGFESTEPKLENYGKGFKFDVRLKAQNLVKLHEVAEKLKNGNITQEQALQEYNNTISTVQTEMDSRPKQTQKVQLNTTGDLENTIEQNLPSNLPPELKASLKEYFKGKIKNKHKFADDLPQLETQLAEITNRKNSLRNEMREILKRSKGKPSGDDAIREQEIKDETIEINKQERALQTQIRAIKDSKIVFIENQQFDTQTPAGKQEALGKIYESESFAQHIENMSAQLGVPKEKCEALLKTYLDNMLDIYSYDSIVSTLRTLSENLSGINGPKVFYIPESGKSYDILAEIYKTHDPNARFITGPEALKEYLQKNGQTNVIILDDCIGSGNSVIEAVDRIKNLPNIQSITSANIVSSEGGNGNIEARFKNSQPEVHLISTKTVKDLKDCDFFKALSPSDQTLLSLLVNGPKQIGEQIDYSESGLSIQFPYMAPNNNSKFAARMLRETFCGPECAIKNIYARIGEKEN